MTLLDPAIPRLIPEGSYTFEIVAEPEKKPNQWGRFFWQIRFIVSSRSGLHFEFSDVFNPTDDKYKGFLLALGGEKDAAGTLRLPDMTFTGQKFEGEIKHVPNKKSGKIYARLANPVPLKEIPNADDEIAPI